MKKSIVLTILLILILVVNITQNNNKKLILNNASKPDIETIEVEEEKTLLGNFMITFYCDCEICNGEWAGEPTASGTPLVEGKTIAVDPSVIPLGTVVEIDGYGFRTAEDTGYAIIGDHIDIFVDNHEQCLENGVQYADVYLVE